MCLLLTNANNCVDENEAKVISSFSADLIARFKKDTNQR